MSNLRRMATAPREITLARNYLLAFLPRRFACLSPQAVCLSPPSPEVCLPTSRAVCLPPSLSGLLAFPRRFICFPHPGVLLASIPGGLPPSRSGLLASLPRRFACPLPRQFACFPPQAVCLPPSPGGTTLKGKYLLQPLHEETGVSCCVQCEKIISFFRRNIYIYIYQDRITAPDLDVSSKYTLL